MKRTILGLFTAAVISVAIPVPASTIVETGGSHCTIATAQDLTPGINNGSVDLLGSVQTAAACGSGAFFVLPVVASGETFNIDLASNGNAYLATPELLDGNGNVLAFGVAGAPFEELITGFIAPSTENYYIAVLPLNSADAGTYDLQVTFPAQQVVPEPSSLTLLGSGVLGVVGTIRRKRLK